MTSFTPVNLVEVAFTTVLILLIVGGAAMETGNFVKRSTLDVQAVRMETAALAATSMPQGKVRSNIGSGGGRNYNISWDDENRNLSVIFGDDSKDADMDLLEKTHEIVYPPGESREVEEFVCFSVTGEKVGRDQNEDGVNDKIIELYPDRCG